MRDISQIDKLIASRIRARRLLLEYSQEYLAASLKMSAQQIHKYETAQSRISASRLAQIAEILMLPASYFFGEEKQSSLNNDILQTLGAPGSVRMLRKYSALPRAYQVGIIDFMSVLAQADDTTTSSKAAVVVLNATSEKGN